MKFFKSPLALAIVSGYGIIICFAVWFFQPAKPQVKVKIATVMNVIQLSQEWAYFQGQKEALETLSRRLTEIQNMNPSSFEYNTAIQQITAQEQGEANAMLSEFKGCYLLNNYTLIWGWIGGIALTIALGCFFVGGIILVLYIAENGFSDRRNRW